MIGRRHSIAPSPQPYYGCSLEANNLSLAKALSASYEFLGRMSSLIMGLFRAAENGRKPSEPLQQSHRIIPHSRQEKKEGEQRETLVWQMGLPIVGCAVGVAANLGKTASVMSKSMVDCKDFSHYPIIGPLNDWREYHYRHLLYRSLPPMIIFPLAAMAIGNGFRREGNEPRTIRSVLSKVARNVSSVIIGPLLTNLGHTLAVLKCREILEKPLSRWKIDISGHSGFHFLYAIFVSNMVIAFSKVSTRCQRKFVAIALGALTAIECFWLYNTSANCHSVIDIACGIALSALSTLVSFSTPHSRSSVVSNAASMGLASNALADLSASTTLSSTLSNAGAFSLGSDALVSLTGGSKVVEYATDFGYTLFLLNSVGVFKA